MLNLHCKTNSGKCWNIGIWWTVWYINRSAFECLGGFYRERRGTWVISVDVKIKVEKNDKQSKLSYGNESVYYRRKNRVRGDFWSEYFSFWIAIEMDEWVFWLSRLLKEEQEKVQRTWVLVGLLWKVKKWCNIFQKKNNKSSERSRDLNTGLIPSLRPLI